MKIFMLDNYDSFTYNLVQYFQILGCDVTARRCDCTTVDAVFALRPDAIVLSPGPGRPDSAGILLELIREGLARQMPMLGVCLGHQAIAEAFGATIYCCEKPLHGVRSKIEIRDTSRLFKELGTYIQAGRYHSWLVDKNTVPDCLKVTAVDCKGEVMALSHTLYDIHGLQFHPESFMTEQGARIMKNFLIRP